MTSRFFRKVARATAPIGISVTRFLSRHRTINRIVRRIPIVTKFMAFFVPDELRLDPPKEEARQGEVMPPPIAPVYNHRARRPRGPRLG